MTSIKGVLDKITFYSPESSYLVGRLRDEKGGFSVTFVGYFTPLQEGEILSLEGCWQEHPRYGRQFKVERWQKEAPLTREGLVKYLASGLIRGIGPVMAERLVAHFGEDVLSVIENEPQRLAEVEGIGPGKIDSITAAYREQKAIKNVMLFLQRYEVTPALAARLFRHYGEDTIRRIEENPYRLADDVHGVGFKTADRIARQMGVPPDSPRRLKACLQYVLSQAAEDGHLFLPQEILEERVKQLVDCRQDLVLDSLLEKLEEERLVVCHTAEERRCVYLAPFYYAEAGTAKILQALTKARENLFRVPEKKVEALLSRENLNLVSEQKEALRKVGESGVLIITGGPGTGKTTTIKGMVALYKEMGLEVALAAPTGRAARRMSEATGYPAKTIHRLLEYTFQEGEGFRFQRNEDEPLRCDLLIVDEASMLDQLLFYHLLKAFPPGGRLILVGDVDQLPSVGAGTVFKDLIASQIIPCVRLQKVFRQARESMIVYNAHLINSGRLPLLNEKQKDFFFIQEEDPEKVAETVVSLCRERLPAYGPYDAVEDIQVLSPMHRTVTGVENLNLLLREALNPYRSGLPEIKSGSASFRLGDKVMQVRNNYRKEVFNGDSGRITHISGEEGELIVTFPDYPGTREVVYELRELEDLVLSYAVSVHKSQGSEYPVVVMPVVTQHYLLLQRNLIYTAITRAKRLVVLVGTKKAIAIAIKNSRSEERFSCLSQRLREC